MSTLVSSLSPPPSSSPSSSSSLCLSSPPSSCVQLSSAAGLVSLLDETDEQLQLYALQQLLHVVDHFWAEIAPAIPKIEILNENDKFVGRSLAAFVASKVFFHLDQLDEALKYALGAGEYFDLSSSSEFVETLISKCVDEYIRLRQATALEKDEEAMERAQQQIDRRLEDTVERMFARCERDGQFEQELGVALESRRLDIVERAISAAPNQAHMLSTAFALTQQSSSVIAHKPFRRQVLQVLVNLFRKLAKPDYIQMCQCLLFLDKPEEIADVLGSLILAGGESTLMAYQVAFDLSESQNQPFLNRVANFLPKPAVTTTTTPSTTTTTTSKPSSTTSSTTSITSSSSSSSTTSTPSSSDPNAMEMEPLLASTSAASSTQESSSASSSTTSSSSSSSSEKVRSAEEETGLRHLHEILSGELPTSLYLNFLFQHNSTDLNILKHMKEKLEQRNSVTHGATVIAHGFMQCGTTIDVFLRDNLEWLGRATNWAKFTATASLGVIHKGHHKQALKLLEPYLPSPAAASSGAAGGGAGSPYAEGGALYALGLIHSSYGSDKLQYLQDALRNAGNNEIVQHGACLGIGLCAIASQRADVFEQLKQVVMSENAVAGEAAAYAMGLVYLGSGNGVAVEEMLAYAHDTQHEKIIRGLAMGIALIVYAQEDEAEVVIEQMVTDKDSIIRYGGMYAIALAYSATANNRATSRLLHHGVTDVVDDVRRAAVTALGFVLCNSPEQVPRVVNLLSESYNPHVRYGACMAVGVACAGGRPSCLKEAVQVLEPLLRDRVDYVRQAAFIAMSMVLIEHNEVSAGESLVDFRKSIMDTMNVKSDTMTKLGAIYAGGIVDAGGRNCTIATTSQAGHRRMNAIVGLALFNQFWYWYPMSHFLSLAFTPTAVIALNQQLQIPKPFTFISKAKPELYDYPKPFVVKVEEKKKQVKHATLSVTNKTTKAKKAAAGAASAMEASPSTPTAASATSTPRAHTMDVEPSSTNTNTTTASSSTTTDSSSTTTTSSSTSTTNTSSTTTTSSAPTLAYKILSNPSRVTWEQQGTIVYSRRQRYLPVKDRLGGIVMLKDTKPHEQEDIVTDKQPKLTLPGVADNEPNAPAPFAYTGN